jgi:hydroxyacylglutathione hydrolase
MILKRFYDENLAQASYLFGCSVTGEALVIDPNRDVEQYIAAAKAERLRILYVAETHIHADFVSGTRELSARTGARMYLSAEGGSEWQYGFQNDPKVELVRDGDRFKVGNIMVQVAHTPGHTPEHVTFFITDGAAADRPIGAVTGDFVFVGDVGRPDLLEKAANVKGTMIAGARQLFRSLQIFKEQPDYLQIWPGHGAGSACGKGLSSIPHSTVGYERLFNWAFLAAHEEEFVSAVLAGQPEPPKYFAEMKRINRDGPRVLGGFTRPPILDYSALESTLASQHIVIDTRRAHDFAARHIPGTINIPLDRSFTTWAGWLVPFDRDFYLILDTTRAEVLDDAVKSLAMIGLDRISGAFDVSVLDEWSRSGKSFESVAQINARELKERLEHGEVHIVDVRGKSEWDAGHIPDAPNIPLGYLSERLAEVPDDKPVVVHCQSGSRSAIGASILRARGRKNVLNLSGGFVDWLRSGSPVERPNGSTPAAASKTRT